MRDWFIEIYLVNENDGSIMPANVYEKATYKLHPSFGAKETQSEFFLCCFWCGWIGGKTGSSSSNSGGWWDGEVGVGDVREMSLGGVVWKPHTTPGPPGSCAHEHQQSSQ